MSVAKPLPDTLLAAHRKWKASEFGDKAAHFSALEKGQNPVAMVISCCDSRVQSTEIFGAPAGTFFLHRNIANLVPPYTPNSDFHGTSSAIEYAIKALKVPHLIIMGHAQCGGVQACYDMCENNVAAADSGFEFVGHWLDILRPAFTRLPKDSDAPVIDMGQQGVLASLESLMGYPFVREAVEAGKLELHGTWHDFAKGTLYAYNPETQRFEAQ